MSLLTEWTRGTRSRASLYMVVCGAALTMASGCVSVEMGGSSDDSSDGDGNTTTSADVRVSWNPPETREDGSDFMASSVEDYELAYGTDSGSYETRIDNIRNTSITIDQLDNGETYYFVVRVRDSDGLVSDYSEELAVVAN